MTSKSTDIISPYFQTHKSTEKTNAKIKVSDDRNGSRVSDHSDEFILPNPPEVTAFQHRVYTHLLLIPFGTITSYAILAKQLSSSPRAVGGALRRNPYAPMVPCHRVIAANGFVGGFMGDWEKAPSGINQSKKLELLEKEGVRFTEDGKLVEREDVWFKGPWGDGKD